MNGREVFKEAVRTLCDVSQEAIAKANLEIEDIDWFVPHQANIRIIESTGKRLGIPLHKTILNIERFANTSAATIPTAFDEAVRNGKIKRGDKILFSAFGAGLTAGSNVFIF